MKIYIDNIQDENLHLTKALNGDVVTFYVYTHKMDVYSLICTTKHIILYINGHNNNKIDIYSKLSDEHSDIVYHFFKIYIKYYEHKLNKDNKTITLNFGHENKKTETISLLFDKYMYLIESRANIINPVTYIEYIKSLIKELNVKMLIKEIICDEKSNLQALYSVGKGALYAPRLLILSTHNSDTVYDVCFVGKGITYDTGGLSLKDSSNMDTMHIDMGGSSLSLFVSIAAYILYNVKVLCVLAIAENAVSQYSYRPGDIIDSYANIKIKALNTDAEGRIVLCDAVSYVCDKYKFNNIIVFATLTGAAQVVAGEDYGVFFTDSEYVNANICQLKNKTGERLVRLNEEEHYYKKMMFDERNISGICNIAPKGFGGGVATGFSFIKHFYKQYKTVCKTYTHVDIATYFDKEPLENMSATNLLELFADLSKTFVNTK